MSEKIFLCGVNTYGSGASSEGARLLNYDGSEVTDFAFLQNLEPSRIAAQGTCYSEFIGNDEILVNGGLVYMDTVSTNPPTILTGLYVIDINGNYVRHSTIINPYDSYRFSVDSTLTHAYVMTMSKVIHKIRLDDMSLVWSYNIPSYHTYTGNFMDIPWNGYIIYLSSSGLGFIDEELGITVTPSLPPIPNTIEGFKVFRDDLLIETRDSNSVYDVMAINGYGNYLFPSSTGKYISSAIFTYTNACAYVKDFVYLPFLDIARVPSTWRLGRFSTAEYGKVDFSFSFNSNGAVDHNGIINSLAPGSDNTFIVSIGTYNKLLKMDWFGNILDEFIVPTGINYANKITIIPAPTQQELYSIQLTVTDSQGNIGTTTQTIATCI
jgi:hypothetical protein